MSSPSRSLLHITHLNEFKLFLDGRGVRHRAGNGDYEVLQVKYKDGWHKLYRRDHMPEHFTVQGKLVPLVTQFYGARKQEARATNAYVKSMERAYPHLVQMAQDSGVLASSQGDLKNYGSKEKQ